MLWMHENLTESTQTLQLLGETWKLFWKFKSLSATVVHVIDDFR